MEVSAHVCMRERGSGCEGEGACVYEREGEWVWG